MSIKAKIGAVVVAGGLLAGGVLGIMSLTVIDQGHAGVIYSRSTGVQDETLGQGWHMVSPFERVTEYPVATGTVKVEKFKAQTKDGKALDVSMSYDYSNELEKLPHIYNKFKGQEPEIIEESWLQTRIKKATLNVFSKYSVLDVFQKQGEINAEIEKEFREMVSKHGFRVDSVTVNSPDPDKKTREAIQGVVDAQQELEKSEIKKKQAIVDAEKKVEEARGEAESERVKAEGTAKANELLRQSLTPEVIQHKTIEAWDGKLPQVTGGSTPMIQVPQVTE
ncbi:prohibitin family protein [Bacillus sp. S0628]|uniref:prohibitin family protein n=1 Tax=Bacillus sp. S0628 TaxID=2957802 RepID=UPI00209DCF0E|nr:prohibitin family protein [Bacillus sp. S0628]MCP1324293.1 prohibitin family protein [Bacillus sp. S0628]